jgi:hypothetical protein
MAVTAYLQKTAVDRFNDQQQRDRELELDRLDALQATIWEQAASGDLEACNVLLKIMALRGKFHGFDKASAEPPRRTLIITGGPEMAAELEAAALAAHPHLRRGSDQGDDPPGPAPSTE